jgi:hypothetical protein
VVFHGHGNVALLCQRRMGQDAVDAVGEWCRGPFTKYNKLAEYSTGICELTSQLTVTVSRVLKIDRFNDSSSYKLDMCFTGVRLRAQPCTASISLQPSNGHAWNRAVAQ